MTENFPNLKLGNKHTSSGNMENPKQDESKEAHTETQLKCQRLKTDREF